MTKTKEKKLTFKQKLFCDWYLKLGGTLHATEAAKRAGYSPKTAYSIASENLRRPEVIAYLNKRRTQIEEILGLNKITILDDLLTLKQMSMKAIPVMYYNPKERAFVQKTEEDDEGNTRGVYTFDSTGANRAIENINRMMGYNEPDKVEDVTPAEKKTPSVVVVNKTYANQEPNQPTPKTD